jgi:hypothetical protein
VPRTPWAAIVALSLAGCTPAPEAPQPPVVSVVANDVVAVAGGSVTLRWSASNAESCEAGGDWSGQREPSGQFDSGPLAKETNVFSLACSGRGGRASAATVVTVPDGKRFGLDFPGSAATEETIRFRFTDPLAIYPATYIWRVNLRSQAEYYTAFFWGNDGEFRWDEGHVPNTYYGAHPYPFPAPNYVARELIGPRYWEISVNALDVLSEQQVEYGRWHVQALRVWSGLFGKWHEFYWDLPDTTKVIRYRAPRSYGEKYPPRPALTWGDAPWAPSKEIMFGVLRGIQIYERTLSVREILAESAEPLSTQAGRDGIWYMNLDPSPTDIRDQSGRGNEPAWVGGERPLAWSN